MAQTYEVEIKSLLGSADNAQKVREALKRIDPSCTIQSRNKQLNHYFTGGELGTLILSAGFAYQAKWSREREEYLCHGINITLDKNAGYGWLAEFEKVVDDMSKVAPR